MYVLFNKEAGELFFQRYGNKIRFDINIIFQLYYIIIDNK